MTKKKRLLTLTPRVKIIKLFLLARVFVTPNPFQPGLIFYGKAISQSYFPHKQINLQEQTQVNLPYSH
jgi:hypothetical protein